MKFPEKKKLVIVPNAVLPERAGSTLHGRRLLKTVGDLGLSGTLYTK